MPAATPRPLLVRVLGVVGYQAALALQHELVDRRARGETDDQILLLEHEPVLTVGRGAGAAAAGMAPFPIVEVERGGEATWHGPGQLVGYPVLRLEPGERDLHRYLRDLEEVLIRALADFGVAATRNAPHTGVWAGGRKLASIGVAVRRWVTYHGFALNVTNDLRAFHSFKPCGLEPSTMGRLGDLVADVTVAAAAARVAARFCDVFGREPVKGMPEFSGLREEEGRCSRNGASATAS